MKILFVYPDILPYALYKGTFYTGVASLSAYIKKNTQWRTELLHLLENPSKENFLSEINKREPAMVAYSATSNMFPYVREWSRWIKEEYPRMRQICGGIHSTLNPHEALKEAELDAVCVGEGEEALAELLNAYQNEPFESATIPNLFFRKNGIMENPIRSLVEDLDELPFPDRELFDYKNLHSEREGTATVMISRGCPYQCTYCCNDTLAKTFNVAKKKYVRFRSVDSAIKELEYIKEKYPFIKKFAFDDDILPLRREWFQEFSEKYKNKIGMPYECNIYPILLSEEVVDLLAESGCGLVRIGIESGSENIRKTILKRSITQGELITNIKRLKNAGIKIYTYNMLGIPGESVDDMLETIKINCIINVDKPQVTIFYPYRGTPLYQNTVDQGLLGSGTLNDYSTGTILEYPCETMNLILFLRNYFLILVRIYSSLRHERMRAAFDRFLKLKALRFTLYPLANIFYKKIQGSSFLGAFMRKFYRAFILKTGGKTN